MKKNKKNKGSKKGFPWKRGLSNYDRIPPISEEKRKKHWKIWRKKVYFKKIFSNSFQLHEQQGTRFLPSKCLVACIGHDSIGIKHHILDLGWIISQILKLISTLSLTWKCYKLRSYRLPLLHCIVLSYL